MKQFKLLSICLCFLITDSFAQQSGEIVRVACVGNSITAGSGIKDSKKDGYPAVLNQLLGEGYEVRNFGFSGRTMLNKGDRPYMKEQMFKDALNFQPNIVVISLGTNDTKPQNWQYKDEYKGDMTAMIDSFLLLPSHPLIYVCYPPKAYDVKWGINDSIIVAGVIPLIDEVRTEKEVPVIDLHTALSDMPENFPDKIHPNEAGAIVLAKEVYRKLTEYTNTLCFPHPRTTLP
ncbi:GDSL-type esterase/lipase family protein [Viscerimonas tarda]